MVRVSTQEGSRRVVGCLGPGSVDDVCVCAPLRTLRRTPWSLGVATPRLPSPRDESRPSVLGLGVATATSGAGRVRRPEGGGTDGREGLREPFPFPQGP